MVNSWVIFLLLLHCTISGNCFQAHGIRPAFELLDEKLKKGWFARKVKDPKNSRVIIFSNFRGSVRDILDALKHIGESVKAREFIGQNAGKNSKGQSQKIQQAVLEKFRTGGYNVIVATSIGEEGLDIMEVDLVICFDANISPLRMIQRMGRTGRNQEGRVVPIWFSCLECSRFRGC
ncbi:DEAD-box ATP-dependent RNA helicase FANCM-like isoform X2 [Salvia splendens]|uniref:DEAD-box ATP-dependent RNA helicase FANCM-like isoform X2 n=1 Tax=Salvia splendens TaxID=180675 RepID=UPI001C25BCFE|nr:DEAD-box ATP-dependent RNA helicase FANCM-like isoform X2 [Salvia splendens]